MRLFLSVTILSALVVGCGGGKGGGGGGDDDVVIDAPDLPPPPDAPPENPPAQGLGKVCDQANPCPAGAPICAMLDAAATHGFCTLTCGMTAAGATMPPTGGDAMCTGSQPAPGAGTPACALTAAPMNNQMQWACGILCGTANGMDLGTCPGGLVCNANLCQ